MTAGMTAYERVVLGFFLIHIIYLFFQSRLLLHPVCLQRVIALIPSHSLLTLWLFTQRELFQASPKKSTLQRKSWQSARKGWKTELCGCSGETFFLKESAPCCQIFSFFLFFFLVFFSPVAIADFLSAAAHREAGRSAGDGGRKIQIIMCYLGHF